MRAIIRGHRVYNPLPIAIMAADLRSRSAVVAVRRDRWVRVTGYGMESIERIVETFEFLDDWDDRYNYLAELGEKLPPLEPRYATPEHQVHGCVSQVWVMAELEATPSGGVLRFRGDSDTPIIKGILAVLLSIYDGLSPDEALKVDTDAIFDRLGIYEHLSPNRHVGVYAMVEKVRSVAKSLQAAA